MPISCNAGVGMSNRTQESVQQSSDVTADIAIVQRPKNTHWILVAFIVLFACCVVFVILTPQDVLQRYPQVVPYVDWMASWNPHVHRLGLRHVSGPLADAHRFCAAVIWGVLTPFLVPLFVVWFVRDEPIKPFTSIRGVFFALTAGPLLALLMIYMPGDVNPRVGRPIDTKLFHRSFFIPGAVGVFWYLTYMTLTMWRSAFRRNFDF